MPSLSKKYQKRISYTFPYLNRITSTVNSNGITIKKPQKTQAIYHTICPEQLTDTSGEVTLDHIQRLEEEFMLKGQEIQVFNLI